MGVFDDELSQLGQETPPVEEAPKTFKADPFKDELAKVRDADTGFAEKLKNTVRAVTGAVGQGLSTQLPAQTGQAFQAGRPEQPEGEEESWANARTREAEEQAQKNLEDTRPTLAGENAGKLMNEIAPNVPQLAPPVVGALTGAVAGFFTPVPGGLPAGAAIGGGAGSVAGLGGMYESDKTQAASRNLEGLDAIRKEKGGDPLTKAERLKAQEEMQPDVEAHGRAEVIPEFLGTAVEAIPMVGPLARIAKVGSPLLRSVLSKAALKEFGKGALKEGAVMAATEPVESAASRIAEGGLENKYQPEGNQQKELSFGKPADWMEAYREEVGPTLRGMIPMMMLGSVAAGGSHVKAARDAGRKFVDAALNGGYLQLDPSTQGGRDALDLLIANAEQVSTQPHWSGDPVMAGKLAAALEDMGRYRNSALRKEGGAATETEADKSEGDEGGQTGATAGTEKTTEGGVGTTTATKPSETTTGEKIPAGETATEPEDATAEALKTHVEANPDASPLSQAAVVAKQTGAAAEVNQPEETENAQHIESAAPPDGGGGTRPEGRQGDGSTPVGGEGVRPGGQGAEPGQPARPVAEQPQKVTEKAEPLTEQGNPLTEQGNPLTEPKEPTDDKSKNATPEVTAPSQPQQEEAEEVKNLAEEAVPPPTPRLYTPLPPRVSTPGQPSEKQQGTYRFDTGEFVPDKPVDLPKEPSLSDRVKALEDNEHAKRIMDGLSVDPIQVRLYDDQGKLVTPEYDEQGRLLWDLKAGQTLRDILSDRTMLVNMYNQLVKCHNHAVA